MKRDRQAVIKQMISRDKIGTQEEIKQRLEAEGITVTQATLSRDLREIGLLKLRDEEGKLYYSLSEHVLPSLDPTVKDYVKSVSRAQFMLVLHTELGEADVLVQSGPGKPFGFVVIRQKLHELLKLIFSFFLRGSQQLLDDLEHGDDVTLLRFAELSDQ